MVAIPVLETGRLRLRGYRLADFDAYFEMFADPAVVRFLGGTPFDREQSWARFMRHVGVWHHLGFGYWAIEDRATGALAGECGFQDMQRGLAPSLDGSMEAGWALAGLFRAAASPKRPCAPASPGPNSMGRASGSPPSSTPNMCARAGWRRASASPRWRSRTTTSAPSAFSGVRDAP